MLRFTGIDKTKKVKIESSCGGSLPCKTGCSTHKPQKHNIDFTDLENQVIDMWENEGVTYFETENVGFNPPEPSHYESSILPRYRAILDDPMACINELGYDGVADYIAANNAAPVKPKVLFYMSGVLSKKFRGAACQN